MASNQQCLCSDAADEKRCFAQVFVSKYRTTLKLPSEFVEHNLTELPSTATLMTKDGLPWPVELSNNSGDVFFTAGWDTFRSVYCPDIFEVLIFKYDGERTFNVTVFGEDSMVKSLQTLHKAVVTKIQDRELAGMDPEMESECRTRCTQVDCGTEVGDIHETSDSDNMSEHIELTQFKKAKVAGKVSVRGDPCPNVVKEMWYKRGWPVYSDGLEDYLLNDGDGLTCNALVPDTPPDKVKFKGGPHFAVELTETHFGGKHPVEIPMKFAKKTMKEGTTKIQITVVGIGEFKISCKLSENVGNATISSGWEHMSMVCGLKVGDTCIFEELDFARKLWKMTLYRDE